MDFKVGDIIQLDINFESKIYCFYGVPTTGKFLKYMLVEFDLEKRCFLPIGVRTSYSEHELNAFEKEGFLTRLFNIFEKIETEKQQ